MVGIYFSGTGNTKFCVKKFLELYNENNTFESYSIEDEICVSKIKENKDGKLILVTAVNPTPAGEGKTTVTIGLTQALQKLGKNAIAALREPSLGP